MRRILTGVLTLFLLFSLFGCTPAEKPSGDKPAVICTVFPPYDFVRQIAGDQVEVSLLLAPGQECHSYEPSPKDIIAIQQCDLFLSVGGESESWVSDLLASVGDSVKTLSLMDCVETVEEETPLGAAPDTDAGEKEYDEHVWTSPKNAIAITEHIAAALTALGVTCDTEPYLDDLRALDAAFAAAAKDAPRPLVFADRFPFRYFADEYGLTCLAAFPGCSDSTEPSAATVATLTDRVKAEKVPVVFYIEFSNQKLADTLCEATGAKKRLFHSCHNLTAAEFADGETYLSLMQKNLTVLKEALSA